MSGERAGRSPGTRALQERTDAYFRDCEAAERFPSVTGLALALGFDCRRELEERAAGGDKAAAVLRRARSRVEEANIQAAYRRDSASGARFLLQNGFGYSDKKDVGLSGGTITVNITDGGDA